MRRLQGEEGGVSVAGGAGGGVGGAMLWRSGVRAPLGARCDGSKRNWPKDAMFQRNGAEAPLGAGQELEHRYVQGASKSEHEKPSGFEGVMRGWCGSEIRGRGCGEATALQPIYKI